MISNPTSDSSMHIFTTKIKGKHGQTLIKQTHICRANSSCTSMKCENKLSSLTTKIFQTLKNYCNDKSFRSNECKCWLSVRHLASCSLRSWSSGCSSAVQAETLSSIINDRKALLDRAPSCGMSWWVWGSIGDGAFVRSYGQGVLRIIVRLHNTSPQGSPVQHYSAVLIFFEVR